MTKRCSILIAVIFTVIYTVCTANAAPNKPTGLMTDLLEHTDRVWRDGFPTNLTLAELPTAIERLQYAVIRSANPSFSWIVNDSGYNTLQTEYELEVATSPKMFDAKQTPDLWQCKVKSDRSTSVLYDGKPLPTDTVCYWRVRTRNNRDELSPWSDVKAFKTDKKLVPYEIARYPLVKTVESPVESRNIDKNTVFCDFGRASFAQVKARIKCDAESGYATVRLGERVRNGRIDRAPAGSTRYAEYLVALLPGTQTYSIKTRVDRRNSSGAAVLAPDYIGEFMPLRYMEIELSDATVSSVCDVRRESVVYPFDETASSFRCDDESLNAVWEMCRYSIKATSCLGVYIDGDRERIPYEGDALLNQLSHYCVDREYSMARYSQQYLLFHPTWPTEWNLQTVQMAWYDYLYTADSRFIARYYDELKAKSLVALAESNGLISTLRGKLTPEVLASIHFKGKGFRDIVDWPHKGLAGNDNAASGETDGFVFQNDNAVVNAYHYFATRSMTRFAELLNKEADRAAYTKHLETLRQSYQRVFFDKARGVYKDGETTEHASLHGNMFPLAFGLVPKEHVASVAAFVRSRGMKCSVYGAQFLLDAVYEGNDGDYGLKCMTETGPRGWLNMLKAGSTISMEAWDDRYKPNQDWNHAWGAAPANIIPRKLVGVEPLEPAFRTMTIKPQPGTLQRIEAKVPTIRGTVKVAVVREPAQYKLTVRIPANTKADVWLPCKSDSDVTTVVGGATWPTPKRDGDFWVLPGLGSGDWTITRK